MFECGYHDGGDGMVIPEGDVCFQVGVFRLTDRGCPSYWILRDALAPAE